MTGQSRGGSNRCFKMQKMKVRTKVKLSPEAQSWHDQLVKDYDIKDTAGKLLLQSAFEAFMRMRDAQAMITQHGIIFIDKAGQLKPNPACTIERDQRSQMLLCLKSLHLDMEIT